MERRQFISLIIVLSILWLNMSCQSTVSKEENFIQFVVQPKLEKGKAASLSIFFKEKPDAGSLQIAKQGDELFATLDAAVIAANIESDGPYYKYQTSIPEDANGNFNLPILEAKIKGKKYHSPAYSVEVLDTVSAGQHPIRMLLQTDKEVYQLKDTINLTLSAYSKFFDVHYTSDAKLVAQGAPSSVFEIADEGHVDYMTGIPGFKAYVDQHFDVVRFVWNA
ncbi:hypothetical protein GQF61_05650 [Sphingobacterium sp. DK4209]|uniref:Uncharacterized protein n=1 Tax=Sphingobacterium zhuxiongii TaxID=2662364 RepID=A0A5Q0QF60_9SPHI|nr:MULTISPECIES: hypothetical protein [unclassified Sphingobacterium]MVZ65331.1 hypothetical protein [Sphingobacterium sp. DK4209]QGA26418.1 hypothetical protein GFH32_08790 [Sphingobacterium sp. dk4302]